MLAEDVDVEDDDEVGKELEDAFEEVGNDEKERDTLELATLQNSCDRPSALARSPEGHEVFMHPTRAEVNRVALLQ